MIRLTVGRKIGGGFLLMGFMVAACGLAGYFVAGSLSRSLNTITGPIWETSEAANQGIRGVQQQLIAVDRVLGAADGQAQGPEEDVRRGEEVTNQAYDRILKTALLPRQELQVLRNAMDDFAEARTHLLQSNTAYRKNQADVSANTKSFQDFLVEVERLASQEILEVQMKGVDRGSATEGGKSDEWATVNSTGEARLALLTRLNLYQQFLDNPDNAEISTSLKQVLGDLQFAVQSITDNSLFDKTTVRNGPDAGKTYATVLKEMVAAHDERLQNGMKTYVGLREAKARYTTAAGTLMSLGEQVMSNSRRRVSQEIHVFGSVTTTGYRTILFTFLLSLLVAVPAALLTVRSIARPIGEVRRQLQDIAQGEGDLSATLTVKGNDEIADLAMAFNAFAGKLRTIIRSVQEAIERLAASTGRISSVGEQTSAEVRRQQQEIDSVAAAVNELSASFQEVAENTSQAADKAVAADQEARSGRELVQHTVSAIQGLASEVDSATEVVNQLGQKSERIGGVLDVIRAISEQTNLLALNAAIEAARAGEQGRGFAVVADEVRSLAARTHHSIAEIQEMIDQLQGGTREAIAVMERGRTRAAASVEQAAKAGASLEHITGVVTGITDLNTHIAQAAEAQSRTVEEVDRSVASISAVTAQTASSTVELASSTQDLTALAGELQSLAGQFRV